MDGVGMGRREKGWVGKALAEDHAELEVRVIGHERRGGYDSR